MSENNVYEMVSGVDTTMEKTMQNMQVKFLSVVERLVEVNKSKGSKLNSARYEIAIGLNIINENKLWIASEFKTIREFAEKILGIKAGVTTIYLKVAKTLLCRDKPINIFGNQDFSINQLYKMASVDVNILKDLVKKGEIRPSMTVKEIDEYLSVYKRLSIKADFELNQCYENFCEQYHMMLNKLNSEEKIKFEHYMLFMKNAVEGLYNEALKLLDKN